MDNRINMEKDKIIEIQSQLIDVLKIQIADLTMMSKIELGDDVIEEIIRLQNILNSLK